MLVNKKNFQRLNQYNSFQNKFIHFRQLAHLHKIFTIEYEYGKKTIVVINEDNNSIHYHNQTIYNNHIKV